MRFGSPFAFTLDAGHRALVLERAAAESTRAPAHEEFARDAGALLWGMPGYAAYLRLDGAVFIVERDPWDDTPRPTPLRRAEWHEAMGAVRVASEELPELAPLYIDRPADAEDCTLCKGTGRRAAADGSGPTTCFACHGLGWLTDDVPARDFEPSYVLVEPLPPAGLSRGLSVVLAGCVVVFTWMMLSGWDDAPTTQRLGIAVFVALMWVLLAAVTVPTRFPWARRVIATAVVVAVVSNLWTVARTPAPTDCSCDCACDCSPDLGGAIILTLFVGLPAAVYAIAGGWPQFRVTSVDPRYTGSSHHH